MAKSCLAVPTTLLRRPFDGKGSALRTAVAREGEGGGKEGGNGSEDRQGRTEEEDHVAYLTIDPARLPASQPASQADDGGRIARPTDRGQGTGSRV